ncbi:MAG: response regulator [Veillonellaceae bacterium]|jgi:CitB family two-component system response regulator MalR|nr:response regulator [Veillonellaceae bacterium]
MIKVLIVEDDPMVAELNRRYLERLNGFTLAAVASSGDQALSYLASNDVDLILLDIFMPNINGLDFLSSLRAQHYGIDVILVTAARDKQSLQEALRHGAVDYLIKPFEFERFKSALVAFKQRHDFIEHQSHIDQTLLDKHLFNQHSRDKSNEFPKGLDQQTMQKVCKCISEYHDDFTAETMADIVGISQVSMRKYLKYLTSVDLLSVNVYYGSVGRPISKYRCTSKKIMPFSGK